MTVRAPYQSVRAEDMEQEEKSGVHRRVSLRLLPASTADCPDERPCPYASCKYNTVANVTRTGTIVLPFGEDIDGWPENNCALDNADLDGMTHQEIGECMGIVRERVRQIEDIALRKLAEPAIRKMLSGYGGPRRAYWSRSACIRTSTAGAPTAVLSASGKATLTAPPGSDPARATLGRGRR